MIKKNKEKILLSIINDKCPITFVKTKIALERLKTGQSLVIHIREGEALDGLPSSLKELGYGIVNKSSLEKGIFSIEINKLSSDT